MLGKRARQIQRTTSMSHLGQQLVYTERGAYPRVGNPGLQSRNSDPAPDGQGMSMGSNGSLSHYTHAQIVQSVEDESDMVMNLEQIAGQCDGLMFAEVGLTTNHVEESLTSIDRYTGRSSYFPPQSSSWANPVVPVLPQAKQLDSAFIQPADFLKTCFFCSRRLGHGQDIYIYRGDAAFCSEDCRNHQISKDERKDKCSMTASKKGNPPTSANIDSGEKVVSSGTAVGA